jgi:hypothetical protein
MRGNTRTFYSRFEVLTEGEPAWARDHRGALYHFDGLRFWQLARKGRVKSVVSWQSPPGGWRHVSTCPCSLCADGGRLHREAA